MPIRYRIDSQQRVIHLDLYGKLTADEIRDFRTSLEQELGGGPIFDRLIDARGLSGEYTHAEIRRLADVVRSSDRGDEQSRRAVVMEDAPLTAKMEVFQAYTRGDPAQYRIFRRMEDAERWLAS
jgi:hypothetical protein